MVHIDFGPRKDVESLNEFHLLAKSTGAVVTGTITASRDRPSVKYFIGKGKALEIAACVENDKIDVVIFNHTISPSQERELERLVKCRILDRTGLILDIFSRRARTHEGKLQVELAQLQYLSTRLIRGWTHLERQKGGIGLRGPGETQLETDRRLIRGRIKHITARLEQVHKQRATLRKKRQRNQVPTVSLVGYTNAGKSTLFNQLAGADTLVADKLFATLDPTFRHVKLPGVGPIMLVDTVGFIRDLPHSLVESFKATLEETVLADVLLHVIDASDTNREHRREQVNAVLAEIGADKVRQIEVYNKVDLMDQTTLANYSLSDERKVFISAHTRFGLEDLLEMLQFNVTSEWIHTNMVLADSYYGIRAKLYEMGCLVEEKPADEAGKHCLSVYLPKRLLEDIYAMLIRDNQFRKLH